MMLPGDAGSIMKKGSVTLPSLLISVVPEQG